MMNTKTPKKDLGWFFKMLFTLSIVGSAAFALIMGGVFWFFSSDLPNIITVEDYKPLTVTRVLGGDGKEEELLAEFYKERRYVIPFDQMPDLLVKAFVSAEDDQFFNHQGINLASMLRASIANFRAGHYVQGGSTITQQITKSLLLTREKSLIRKIKEVILASRLERNLTKQQILFLYLNQIYLGHGAYGVQAAAKTYFRKDVKDLTLAECAILAGMPQAPGKYSPNLNPQKAKERQRYVLRRMYESNYISVGDMNDAASQMVRIFHDDDLNKKYAPYLVEQVRRELVEKFGDKAVYEDGLTVLLSTTRTLGSTARAALQEGLRGIDHRIGYRGPLKVIKDPVEVEKTLEQIRNEMIESKVGYTLFMPDGRLDSTAAIKDAGITTESQLLEVGKVYKAVVIKVDDRQKEAIVQMGAVQGILPHEHLKWAKGAKDEKNPEWAKYDPSLVSRVLTKGDLIWIKVISFRDSKPIVALEQDSSVEGALYSVDVRTGNVLAMEGGFDFARSEFNRATQAARQAGSAFKPILYTAGLEKGFTPASVIVDAPLIFSETDEQGTENKWKPDNFGSKFYGDTTFRQSLIKSRNVPTIKIAMLVGVQSVVEFAKRLGFTSEFPKDLSISLGSSSVSLRELTDVYAVFPRLGKKFESVLIRMVKDRDGKVLAENKAGNGVTTAELLSEAEAIVNEQAALPDRVAPSPIPAPQGVSGVNGLIKVNYPVFPLEKHPAQVLDPRLAYVMTHLMKEVVNYGTGHDAKALGRTAAGKTGTTNDSFDAWFMGFTPHVVTGVWVGHDNQKTIGGGETGAKAALPIWLQFMQEAVKAYPDEDFPVPPGISFATLNSETGRPVSANSPNAIREAFVEGTEPRLDSGGQSNSSTGSDSDFLKEELE